MSYKRKDLTLLSALTSQQPRTYWSIDAYESATVDTDMLWRLRADDQHGLPRYGLTRAEVMSLAGDLRRVDCVIQENLTPELSGACYLNGQLAFWEAVSGEARIMLRGGGRGSRGVLCGSRESWRLDRQGLGERAVTSLSPAVSSLSLSGRSLLLEWILDHDARFLWVDAKQMPGGCFSNLRAPVQVYSSSAQRAGEPLVLPDTSLTHWPQVVASGASSILCEAGSPLAHLCTRAISAGLAVDVVETEFAF